MKAIFTGNITLKNVDLTLQYSNRLFRIFMQAHIQTQLRNKSELVCVWVVKSTIRIVTIGVIEVFSFSGENSSAPSNLALHCIEPSKTLLPLKYIFD